MIIENDSLVTGDKKLVIIFNDHYINKVETSSGIKPNFINYEDNDNKKKETNNFGNHPSIIKINQYRHLNISFQGDR